MFALATLAVLNMFALFGTDDKGRTKSSTYGRSGVGGSGGAPEVDLLRSTSSLWDIRNLNHASDSTRGCCGGLITLRGTPPQHLFGAKPRSA